MPRIRRELGAEPGLDAARSASSDTSGQGAPRARCRKPIRARSAVAASVQGSVARPSRPQPLAHGAARPAAGEGSASLTEASSIAPSRVARRATTRPSGHADLVLLVPQRGRAASRARSSSSGAADRIVASRTPGRRSASATASQPTPDSAVSPRPSTAPVPDAIR